MNTRIVILAAGNGKRMNPHTFPGVGMNSDISKVLLPITGKPMIIRLAETVKKTCLDQRPVVVVGPKTDVRGVLGTGFEYVVQEKQLGTGHAVLCAEAALRGRADAVIVLYGDTPRVKAETLERILSTHEKEQPEITMATATVDDFEDWRMPLKDFGRIVRNKNGDIEGIIEKKDATPEQLSIRELNPSFFCFRAEWLWDALKKIDNNNAQMEYYLTDLVEIAIRENKKVVTVDVDPAEALGVNTPEHLELLQKIAP